MYAGVCLRWSASCCASMCFPPFLELAGLAVVGGGLNPSAVQCLLLHPHVINGLNALSPCVDSCPVDIAGGGGVREKQGAGAALIHPVGGDRVGVDQFLVAELVRVLE